MYNDEKQMHPQRFTVWCAFRSRGINEPSFLQNEAGNALTVNCESYCDIITQLCVLQL